MKINNGVIVEGDNIGEIFVLHGDVKDSFNNSFNKTLKEAPEPKTDSADKIEALKKELENIRDGINTISENFEGTQEDITLLKETMDDVESLCKETLKEKPLDVICASFGERIKESIEKIKNKVDESGKLTDDKKEKINKAITAAGTALPKVIEIVKVIVKVIK